MTTQEQILKEKAREFPDNYTIQKLQQSLDTDNIEEVTDGLRDLLIEKNNAYGNSALSPINVFSKGNAIDSLLARIDDKLSRIKNRGLDDKTEDTLFDLVGYFILLIIARKNEKDLHE